ncbi:MAG: ABC-2 family transporter protein [Spirochaetales bacterium]|nr:ABC-2 family transporter protein [Spirochaetales bacterium]
MNQTLRIWQRGLKSAVANRIAYRGDFFISLAVMLLFEAVTPLLTFLIYGLTNGRGFPGWSLFEVLLIQSVFLLSRGISQPFFWGLVWTVHQQVREGIFELTLLKPRSEILVCMTMNIDIQSFGRFAGGLAFFIFVLSRLPAPGLSGVLSFLLLFSLSLAMMFSLALIMAGTLFVWVGNSRLMELMETLLEFAKYPGSIFTSVFQLVTAVVLPVAMVALFPARALLGRPQPWLWGSMAAVCCFAAAALGFWKYMVKKYTGAGG